MTKKLLIVMLLLILLCALLLPTVALANSAAPDFTGVGSGIVFEQYEDVGVVSQVLDIVFDNRNVTVTATYNMVNNTSSELDVFTMFILPAEHVGSSFSASIYQDNKQLDFSTSNYYVVDYDTTVTLDDWQYIVENGNVDPEGYSDYSLQVCTVSYNMHFDASANSTVVVEYSTQLGGLISYGTTVEFLYYLTPAQYWSDYSNLTINLTLDDNHPRITYSSINFDKTGDYTYVYTCDTLPEQELSITAGQSWWDTISLSSRIILAFVGIPLAILCLIMSALVLTIILFVRNRRFKNGKFMPKSPVYFKRLVAVLLFVLALLLLLNGLALCLSLFASFDGMVIFMLIVNIASFFLIADYIVLLLDNVIKNNRYLANIEKTE